MEKLNKLLIIILCLFLTTISCTKNFEEINSDPNRLSEIGPSTLLNPLLYDIANVYAKRSYHNTFALMQVMVPYPSASGGLHRYDLNEGHSNSMWNNSYQWLVNLREMQKACMEYNTMEYLAISYTLEAYVLSNLTDVFGDVPMNEAGKGEEKIYYPKFDTQEEVYDSVLSKLNQANMIYNNSDVTELAFHEELLFHNSLILWQKFNNSLLLRSLLRISGVAPDKANNQMAELLSNPEIYPIILNDEESAVFEITGVYPNNSPWSRHQDFRTGMTYSEFFFENLNNFNDPRLPFFADKAKDIFGTTLGYKGIPSGYNPENQYPYTPSLPNSDQIIAPMKVPFITYAEVEFIQAELVLKGIKSGNAKQHYENGVRSAICFITNDTIDNTYFQNEYTQYNGTHEQVMLQKYYALYFTDYQQWFEYRRTGFPVLPKPEIKYRDQLPRRFYYPDETKAFNSENVEEVLIKMKGEDNPDYPVWWDIE
jgi:hypothetical protein